MRRYGGGCFRRECPLLAGKWTSGITLFTMSQRPHFLDRTGLILAVAGTLFGLLVHVGGWAYSGSILPGCAPSDSTSYCASIWIFSALTLMPPVILLFMLLRDRGEG